MAIDSFATGNNWHEPYVSGRDVLYEKIIEDYERCPDMYEDWEREILDKDSTKLSKEEEKCLLEYMEAWIFSEDDYAFW